MYKLKTTVAMLGLAATSALSSCINTEEQKIETAQDVFVPLPGDSVVASDRFIKQTDSNEVVLYHVFTMFDSSEYVVEKVYNFRDNQLAISVGNFKKGSSSIDLMQVNEMTFDQLIEEEDEQEDMNAAFDLHEKNNGPAPK